MKSKAILWAISFLALMPVARAEGRVVLGPLANPGFVHFYNNEYDQALAIFRDELKLHPNDPNRYNYIAQTILYREMYRDGALESQLVSGNNPFLRRPKMEVSANDKRDFADAVTHSIELSEAALHEDSKNTRALYSLAVAHGLRANYLFLVEKSWLDSLHDAIAGRKADDQILKIDPGFVDAHLIRGVSEYVVGCLPAYLRALGAFNGFHGDKQNGLRELQLVSQSGVMNQYDASILLAAIYRRERRPKEALPLLKNLTRAFPRNHLLRFEEVQMYSDLGDKKSALELISEIENLRCNGTPGYADLLPEKVQYLRGNLLFWYGDFSPALTDLRQVTLKANDLDLGTAVMAWLRLGQVLDMQGAHSQAEAAYEEAIKTAPKSDAAAEARGYLSKPYQRKPAAA